MVGQHHQLNGHESEQALGGSEGQGILECCSPWGRKESDTTERLNGTGHRYTYMYMYVNHFAVQQKLTQHRKSTILQLKIDKKEQT